MTKTTTNGPNIPATDSLDPEVLAFRQAFDGRSPLDEIIHEGARRGETGPGPVSIKPALSVACRACGSLIPNRTVCK